MIRYLEKIRGLTLTVTFAGIALLTGCAGIAYDAARSKQDAIQLPLTALPDGAQFDWTAGVDAGGEIRIESTFSKGSTVCRVVSEAERIEDNSSRVVATYCLAPNGEWR